MQYFWRLALQFQYDVNLSWQLMNFFSFMDFKIKAHDINWMEIVV